MHDPHPTQIIVGLKLCWVVVSFIRWGRIQNFRPLGSFFIVEVEFVVEVRSIYGGGSQHIWVEHVTPKNKFFLQASLTRSYPHFHHLLQTFQSGYKTQKDFSHWAEDFAVPSLWNINWYSLFLFFFITNYYIILWTAFTTKIFLYGKQCILCSLLWW